MILTGISERLFSPSQTAMEAMGLIAIIVNCYLIGQCGQLQRLFPWLSPEMAIISIVILEVPQKLLLIWLQLELQAGFSLAAAAFCDRAQNVRSSEMCQVQCLELQTT